MPRHVVIFCHTYFPYVGGAEVALREITDRLPAFTFTLITARLDVSLPVRERVGRLTVHRVGNGSRLDKYRYPWLAARAAAQLHAQRPCQLAWGMLGSWGGWAALRFAERTPGVRYLLTEQSGDSEWFIRRRTWWWRRRYRQIFRRADAVQVISRYLADRVRRYGYRGTPVIIPNGVDLRRFQPTSEAATARLRAELQLPAGAFVCISVSRLERKNGLRTLVAALSVLIHRFNQPAYLVLAGSGKLEARLKAQASELGIRQYVRFCGTVDHARLPTYLSAADAFVRPSRSEGLGIAFLEAMAMGLPVVATPVGGIPDFLTDGDTGLVVPPGNPSALAATLDRLMTDPALRQHLGQRGRELVATSYDWDTIAKAMGELLERVLESKKEK